MTSLLNTFCIFIDQFSSRALMWIVILNWWLFICLMLSHHFFVFLNFCIGWIDSFGWTYMEVKNLFFLENILQWSILNGYKVTWYWEFFLGIKWVDKIHFFRIFCNYCSIIFCKYFFKKFFYNFSKNQSSLKHNITFNPISKIE